VQGIAADDKTAVGRAVQRWYGRQARAEFSSSLDRCLRHFSREAIPAPALVVKRLARRWGSMSPDGRLVVLNTRLVEAARPAIDYVIVHELCHAVHPHHGSEFFELLQAKIPDWESRKRQLERALA
jgi:predicted metal-dependent hydrolase